jgi:hypothetical protein
MSAADEAALRAQIKEGFRLMDAARAALKRHDPVIPIEAGRILRNERGPGTYERAVEQQQMRAVLDASRRPPVPGELPVITELRNIFSRAKRRKPRGTPSA